HDELRRADAEGADRQRQDRDRQAAERHRRRGSEFLFHFFARQEDANHGRWERAAAFSEGQTCWTRFDRDAMRHECERAKFSEWGCDRTICPGEQIETMSTTDSVFSRDASACMEDR